MKFTAKDFKHVTLGHHGATPTIEQTAANLANARLKEWLEAAPVVELNNEGQYDHIHFVTDVPGHDRHYCKLRGRLVDITEVKG